MSHLVLMVTYAFLISVFFAVLWRHDFRSRAVLFSKMFFALVLVSLAVAWLMYFFPVGSPAGLV